MTFLPIAGPAAFWLHTNCTTVWLKRITRSRKSIHITTFSVKLLLWLLSFSLGFRWLFFSQKNCAWLHPLTITWTNYIISDSRAALPLRNICATESKFDVNNFKRKHHRRLIYCQRRAWKYLGSKIQLIWIRVILEVQLCWIHYRSL